VRPFPHVGTDRRGDVRGVWAQLRLLPGVLPADCVACSSWALPTGDGPVCSHPDDRIFGYIANDQIPQISFRTIQIIKSLTRFLHVSSFCVKDDVQLLCDVPDQAERVCFVPMSICKSIALSSNVVLETWHDRMVVDVHTIGSKLYVYSNLHIKHKSSTGRCRIPLRFAHPIQANEDIDNDGVIAIVIIIGGPMCRTPL
jgi:hypothetical protein